MEITAAKSDRLLQIYSKLVNGEIFGKGIDMWLRSQGEYVKVAKEGEQ